MTDAPRLATERLLLLALDADALEGLIVRDRAQLERLTGARFPEPLAAPPLMEDALPFMGGQLRTNPDDVGWWPWLIVVAATGYACGPLLMSRGLSGLDGRAAMGVSLALAALVLTPVAALDPPTEVPPAGALAAIAVLGIVCTAAAFVAFAELVRTAGPSRSVIITYVNPVIALALGVALLGEQPGAGALAGLVLILLGSWLSTDGRLPAPVERWLASAAAR